jgi:hypothetical protein
MAFILRLLSSIICITPIIEVPVILVLVVLLLSGIEYLAPNLGVRI